MTTYLLSIYVTFEQEAVIRKVFKDRNWTFRKLGLQPHIFEADADQYGFHGNDLAESKVIAAEEAQSHGTNYRNCQLGTCTNGEFPHTEQSNTYFMSTDRSVLQEDYVNLDNRFIKTEKEEDCSESCKSAALMAHDPKGSEETDRTRGDKSVPSLLFVNERCTVSEADKNNRDDDRKSKDENIEESEIQSANSNYQESQPCLVSAGSWTTGKFALADQSSMGFMSTERPSLNENYNHLDTGFIKSEEDGVESSEDASLMADQLQGSEKYDCDKRDKVNLTFPALKRALPLQVVNEKCPEIDNNRDGKKKSGDEKNVINTKRKTETANVEKEIETHIHLSSVQPTQETCKEHNGEISVSSLEGLTDQKEESSATCTGCGRTYSTASDLKKHLRNDRCAAANNVCPICGKVFRKYEHELLKVHIRQHKGERPYQCTVCGKSFASKVYLDRHMLCHSDDMPYCCAICKMQFKLKWILQSHEKNMHGDRTKEFQCDICGALFMYKGSLSQHRKAVHVTERLIQCDLCDKTFKTKRHLRVHKMTHSQERKHVCNICGKSFKFRTPLNRHMGIHSGEKPYKCSKCDYSSQYSGNLTKHMRIHSGEKPYKCSQCSYCCARSGNLSKHMKVHDHKRNKSEKNEKPLKVP